MALPYLLTLLDLYPLKNNHFSKDSEEYMAPLIESADWAWWRIWFGRHLNEEEHESLTLLATDVCDAIRGTDLLGYHKKCSREILRNGWSLFRRSFGLLTLSTAIQSVANNLPSHSASINVALLKSGVLEDFLANSNRVMLITSHKDAVENLENTFGKKFDQLLIPRDNPKGQIQQPQMKLVSNSSFSNMYQEIVEIGSTCERPDLVLVGGGLIGKVLANKMAEIHDTPSLDIGAVFDVWAGRKTRHWMD
jgi:hypothetical protein